MEQCLVELPPIAQIEIHLLLLLRAKPGWDAQTGQVGRQGRRLVEAEFLAELQAVGRARDRSRRTSAMFARQRFPGAALGLENVGDIDEARPFGERIQGHR